MKAYLLIALFPIVCYAQKERSTSQQRPAIDDCPTWTNKPKSSKAAYFEQARLGKKATKPVQTTNPEIPGESEQEKLIKLNKNRKIVPESPWASEEKVNIPKKEEPVETAKVPSEEKEISTTADQTEKKQEEVVLENEGTTHVEKPKKVGKEKVKKDGKKIRKRKIHSGKKTKTPRSKKQKCPEF